MSPSKQEYSVPGKKIYHSDIRKYTILMLFIGSHGVCDIQVSVNHLSELLGNSVQSLGWLCKECFHPFFIGWLGHLFKLVGKQYRYSSKMKQNIYPSAILIIFLLNLILGRFIFWKLPKCNNTDSLKFMVFPESGLHRKTHQIQGIMKRNFFNKVLRQLKSNRGTDSRQFFFLDRF